MNSECCICFEIVQSNGSEKPFVTRCGHLFHDTCIKNCLQNEGYGKCPQCNQPIARSQLIRLYVNEREHADRRKNELVVQLEAQLREMHEKAQLQYDLIVALNNQIALGKKLSSYSRKERYCDSCKLNTVISTTSRAPNNLKRIVTPANVVAREVGAENSSRLAFAFDASSEKDNTYCNLASASGSRIAHSPRNVFSNTTEPSDACTSDIFVFDDTQEASSSTKPTITPDLINTNSIPVTTQNFTFGPEQGSRTTFNNCDEAFIQHTPVDITSKTTSIFESEAAAAASFSISQNRNRSALPQSGTTSNNFSTPPVSKNVKKRNLNSSRLQVWNQTPTSNPSSVPSTFNSLSAGIFGGVRKLLPLNLSCQVKTYPINGGATTNVGRATSVTAVSNVIKPEPVTPENDESEVL